MKLKNYRNGQTNLINKGNLYTFKDVYDLIKRGVEIEFINVCEYKVLLKSIKLNEDCKDVALMNRIIRNGGLSEYARKLNVNYK